MCIENEVESQIFMHSGRVVKYKFGGGGNEFIKFIIWILIIKWSLRNYNIFVVLLEIKNDLYANYADLFSFLLFKLPHKTNCLVDSPVSNWAKCRAKLWLSRTHNKEILEALKKKISFFFSRLNYIQNNNSSYSEIGPYILSLS